MLHYSLEQRRLVYLPEERALETRSIRPAMSKSNLAWTTQLVAALVVAPQLDATTVMNHLRRRIDLVFLPRPLLFVDALPRNETGKLPYEALRSLALKAMRKP